MTSRQYLHLHGWRRKFQFYSFTKKSKILTNHHLDTVQLCIQPQRHLFQLENSKEAIKSGTILNIICICCNVNKPFIDWYPQAWWPPCIFVIRDGSLLRYCPRLVRVSLSPFSAFPQGVGIPTPVPRVQTDSEGLVLWWWDGIRAQQLQSCPRLGEIYNSCTNGKPTLRMALGLYSLITPNVL